MSGRRSKHIDEDYEEEVVRKPSKKKKKKKRHIFLKILLVLLMLIAIALGTIVGFAYSMLDQMEFDNQVDKNTIEVNDGVETAKGTVNIALFGVDARNQKNSYSGSLSDVIMIVSINQDTKKVRIASVYRDTYLQMSDTKKFDKITHAFGRGPQISNNSLNSNLDMDIKDYVAINFNVVVDVVDAEGVVTVDVTREEALQMTNYIDEINNTTGHKSKHLTKAGTYTLDGVQATAYARIRYTEGGDWKRTERQRKILDLTFEKVKKMNLAQLKSLADTVLKQVSTNITTSQIISLAASAGSYEIEETKGWPFEVADYKLNGVWYGPPRNLEKQVIELHEFLFPEEEYEPSENVRAISDKLIKQTGIK